jgi:hypothetical protein
MPRQSQKAGRTVGVTAPTGPVRGLFRARPWPATAPEPGTYGRIADDGSPESRLEALTRWSAGVTRAERAGCKTVGLAYVGSNPTPATIKLAGQARSVGPGLMRFGSGLG